MSVALPNWLPRRRLALPMVARAVLVGVTVLVLGNPLVGAGSVAVLFLALELCGHAAQSLAGDYADNVMLGVLVLAGTAYLGVSGLPVPAVAVGGLVGGWLVVDGIQHLRHGVSRDQSGVPYTHDGGPVTGLLRALGARVLEPFRL